MSAASEDWIERARRTPIELEIARRGIRLKRNGAAEQVGPCPRCGGTDRFSINTVERLWNCRGCGRGGDVIDLVEHLDGVDFLTACETLTGEPRPPPNGKAAAKTTPTVASEIMVAQFDYHDRDGSLAFAVERIEFRSSDGSPILTEGGKPEKTFRQKRPDPDRPGEWLWNVKGVPSLPYRLPELIEAIANERFVVIVEGEGKCDLLRGWNVSATCNAGGAGKWRAEHAAFFRDAHVVVIPDHDPQAINKKTGEKLYHPDGRPRIPGRDHAEIVGASLQGIAASIKTLELPGLPPKGDVVDWAKAGGTREALDELIAREAKPWAPAGAPPQAQKWNWHFHGDPDVAETRKWLVRDLLPEVGAGLMSGQWGLYKTFAALDLAASAMSGRPFAGFEIDRRGGVLFIACEGQNEMPIRLAAIVKTKFEPDQGKIPFGWIGECPRLLDPKGTAAVVEMVKAGADRMMAEFGLPVVLIVFDTAGKAAGYAKTGDENDSTIGRAIVSALETLARKTQTCVIGIDHFGKDVEVGTRGTSSKEDDFEFILALLGERSLAGAVTNPRMAIRKRKGGETGLEIPFRTEIVEVGEKPDGRPETTLVILWTPTAAPENVTKAADWSKSTRLLRQVMMNILVDHGQDMQPFPDGPVVRAADIEIVRAEYYRSYPADGDDKAKKAAKRQAFNRATKDAQVRGLIGVREINNVTFIWLAKTPGLHETPPPGALGEDDRDETPSPPETDAAQGPKRFRRVDDAPADAVCAKCYVGGPGIARWRDGRKPGSKSEVLHEKCCAEF